MPPTITSFSLGPFETNCFVVRATPDAPTCWIVDCGFDPEPLLDYIEGHGLRPVALLLTHCHSDHIAGVDRALTRFGKMPMYVHESEAGFCTDPMLNLSGMIGLPIVVTEPDHLLRGGETLELDGTRWRVMHTPGHSPGGVVYVHDESHQAIVGDVVFAGSIGRSDFPTSDPQALSRSVRAVLSLPDETILYPGHGPKTTVAHERATNPYA